MRMILEAFGAAHASEPVELSLGGIGDASELRAAAEEMVARGWLRSTQKPDTFRRTEDGRLAIAAPLDVTLYSRRGCHLCEEMKAQAAPLIRRAGAHLREVNIDEDEVLRERYDTEVPVLLLGARKVAKYFLDVEQFRRQLEAARRNSPAED